jgi:hypothetical protein
LIAIINYLQKKTLTLKYRFRRLYVLNKKELSVISLLGDYDEFRPYSIVFDVFDSHEDSYIH